MPAKGTRLEAWYTCGIMGLDREHFARYVENLPRLDRRVQAVTCEVLPGAPANTVAYRVDIAIPAERAFSMVFLPGNPDQIGIYQPLKRLNPQALPIAEVDALSDWWDANGQQALFKIGLSPDGVLLLAAEGSAERFAAHETRRWVSGLISAVAQVLPQVQLRFPD